VNQAEHRSPLSAPLRLAGWLAGLLAAFARLGTLFPGGSRVYESRLCGGEPATGAGSVDEFFFARLSASGCWTQRRQATAEMMCSAGEKTKKPSRGHR